MSRLHLHPTGQLHSAAPTCASTRHRFLPLSLVPSSHTFAYTTSNSQPQLQLSFLHVPSCESACARRCRADDREMACFLIDSAYVNVVGRSEPRRARTHARSFSQSTLIITHVNWQTANGYDEERKGTTPQLTLEQSDAEMQLEVETEAEPAHHRTPPTADLTPLSSPCSLQSAGSESSWHQLDSSSPKHA